MKTVFTLQDLIKYIIFIGIIYILMIIISSRKISTRYIVFISVIICISYIFINSESYNNLEPKELNLTNINLLEMKDNNPILSCKNNNDIHFVEKENDMVILDKHSSKV